MAGRLSVGDFSTFRSADGIFVTDIVIAESYDSVRQRWSVTWEKVGGPLDGRLEFFLYTPDQNLFQGFDATVVLPNIGLTDLSWRYSPALSTLAFPICPQDMQHASASFALSAPGFETDTGNVVVTTRGHEWSMVSVPFGTFSAFRITKEVTIRWDAGYPDEEGLTTTWVVPGLGAVKLVDETGLVSELWDTSATYVPEPARGAAAAIALLALGLVNSLRTIRRAGNSR